MHPVRSRLSGLRHSLPISIALVGALVLVPVVLALSRTYAANVNIPPGVAVTDGVRHNHTYNEVFWSSGAAWPAQIHESTICCGNKWIKTGNGNLALSHAATWFAEPLCANRDSITHFATYCVAFW